MDPNLTLARIRAAVRCVNREQDGTDEPFRPDQALNVLRNMAEYVESLDQWLTTGGFAPEAWNGVSA